MKEDILATKTIIKTQIDNGKIYVFGKSFSKYQKVYCCTNENINGYMNKFNFDNKENALTVMASGDHVFNLACNDILYIDTFDTNILTEYYVLGIKRSAILAFD